MCKNSILKVVLILTFISLQCGCSLSKEPRNIFYAKQEIIKYYDSGAYDAEVAKVVSQAKSYLAQRIKANNALGDKKKLAMVLDIDDTLLSHYKNLRQLDFGISNEIIVKESVAKWNLPAITATLDLYNFAKKNNIAIFLICARKADLTKITIKNLHDAGYSDWSGLYLRPLNYKQKSFVDFKTNIRKTLTKSGYAVIINMGDQYSDLRGGYAEKAFKLPNPLYRSV